MDKLKAGIQSVDETFAVLSIEGKNEIVSNIGIYR